MGNRIILTCKISTLFTLGYVTGSFLNARFWLDTMPGAWRWGWLPCSVVACAASWWLASRVAKEILRKRDRDAG